MPFFYYSILLKMETKKKDGRKWKQFINSTPVRITKNRSFLHTPPSPYQVNHTSIFRNQKVNIKVFYYYYYLRHQQANPFVTCCPTLPHPPLNNDFRLFSLSFAFIAASLVLVTILNHSKSFDMSDIEYHKKKFHGKGERSSSLRLDWFWIQSYSWPEK